MHYLIYGTGAVGGYLGCALALAGNPVTFLARAHIAEAMLTGGLRLGGEGPAGHLEAPQVITTLEQAWEGEAPDVVLLCVKAYDCGAAADALQALPAKEFPVVSLLNGINNEQTLAASLGEGRVIPATLTTAVQMIEPGVLRVERLRGVGFADGHASLPALLSDFQAAGLEAHRYPDPARMKWSKLLTNIVTNATSAILGWMPSQIFTHPKVAALEIEALREAVRVMAAMGIRPQNLPHVPVAVLGRAIFMPYALTRPILGLIVGRGRGEKKPSFHYDIGRGRSEVRWLNGAVVSSGRELGVPTPVNAALTDTLLSLVHGEVNPEMYLNRPDKLLAQAAAYGWHLA